MSRAAKSVSIVVAVYLLTGIFGTVRGLSGAGVARAAAAAYLACIVLGLLACVAAFAGWPRAFRYLSLWALGPLSIVYLTRAWALVFPAFLHAIVKFGSHYSTGEFYYFGFDLVPGAMFVALWFLSKKDTQRGKATSA